MGGFWALKYASALGADAAVVFSPRASTDPADPLPGEPRSAPQPVPEAQTPQGIGPEDLPPCALVAYDPTEPTDAPQASHLGGMPGVRLVPMARAGRNPVRVLTGAEEADAVFALAGEGRLDEAARALRAMRHRSPHAWLGLGVSAHLAGKKARARRLFDQARRLGVRPKAILMAQAQAAIWARRPDYAAAALRRLRRLDPTDPRIPLALGQQLLALGHHAAAALAFRNAVAEEPDHLPGRLGLIEALERQGALKEALKAAEAAVAALPEAAALRARLDRARRALARSAKGIRPGTASGDAATAPAGGCGRGAERGDGAPRPGERATAVAMGVRRAAPGAAGATQATTGVAAPENDEPASAVARLRARLAAAPQDELAHLRLIDALLSLGNRNAALLAARDAVARLPDSAKCQFRLGRVALPDHPADAEAAFRAAIACGRADEATLSGLCLALTRLDRKDEALAVAREVARAFPDSAECQARFGLLATGTEPAEAEAALRAAIALGDASEQVAMGLCNLLQRQGRLADAIAALQHTAGRFPDRPEIWIRIGLMQLQQEDAKGAEEAFRAALAIREDLLQAQLGLCDALRLQKRIKEAVAAFRRGEALGAEAGMLRPYRFRLFGE
jgi:predicted Zn-dependent protease